MGRTLVANRLLAGSACGKRQRGRPLNAIVRLQTCSLLARTLAAMVRRRVLLTIFITVLSFAAFCALAANVSEVFIAGILFSIVIGGIALMAISCPKCGHSVLFQKSPLLGGLRGFAVFSIPEVCENCGHKL